MDIYNGDTLRKLLKDADQGGYAVPMFNYTDLWDQMAVIEAAMELHAPIMFASIPKTVHTISPEILGAVGTVQMKKAASPIIHHLDHAKTAELCMAAIDNGYPSVMIDASDQDLETNIAAVKRVVEYAHPRGVFVEGEIGRIKGRDYEAAYEGDDFLARVDDALRLVQETGVDSLAIGIGTAHGFYDGKPEINFKRLEEMKEAIAVPLVLHGGTGIPEEDVKKAIRLGINKVNIGTQIRYTYMRSACRLIQEKGPVTHTIDIMTEAKKEIKEVAKTWIRICMADGKAKTDRIGQEISYAEC
ncbi:class II fructose-bisphosphate aldolase [Diplocloster hominis]|uniref:class II fructose-bisphosphate aldolase n=1 Tax=Diplocloster hominis TaxID=3079010 RepID=UPI0031B9DE01